MFDSVLNTTLNYHSVKRNWRLELHARSFHSRCVKSVRIRSFFGLFLPIFGLTTEIYSVNLRSQSKCEKIQTRKTLNTDTFHVVFDSFVTFFSQFSFSQGMQNFSVSILSKLHIQQDVIYSKTLTTRISNTQS